MSEAASQAIVDQADYYLEQSGLELVLRWESAVFRTIQSLQLMPRRAAERTWENRRLQGLRAVPIEGFANHLLFYFYSHEKQLIQIVHVLHGARDLESILSGVTSLE